MNTFWGIVDADGDVVEHFGRKCRGGSQDANTFEFKACGYRFRFKLCEKCSHQNDLSARKCDTCGNILVDAQAKLQQAKLSKDAHVLRPDSIEMSEGRDRSGNPFLQVKYYDFDARFLSEIHYVNNLTAIKKFNINFLRSHMKRPELRLDIRSVDQIVRAQAQFRMPAFVIGRRQGKFWKITEKIFAEELV
ncbi:MAG: zinc ribbon domain-containing protein [Bdellovibrionota bacterium]